ncbi:hypothetical protein N7494_001259 [Penicillium frequentans]|uniref:Uncharacterized protein n=1 Tax=Penicillium frequentans TaxID=3151616 RepID=A0AAD6GJR8_9EURO|nr:hypothetical protein N7494_001259 [Penicillium glabrum]
MTLPEMDNSGAAQLQIPAFGGIPIDYEFEIGQRFVHGALPERPHQRGRATRLTITELFMLRLMDRVTEIPDWEHGVFNDKVVAQWYADAIYESKSLEYPNLKAESQSDLNFDMDLVSQKTWDWCIAELQDKAEDLKNHNFVLTLNADSGVCKSDELIGDSLQVELQRAFENYLPRNIGGGSSEKDHSSAMHDLVDPSMFMLVYGQTAVLSQGGVVPMADSGLAYPTIESKAIVAPKQEHPLDVFTTKSSRYESGSRPYNNETREFYRWSNRFQWLPCEVEFTGREASDTEVRITSYINNLHPKDQQAYAAIGKLVSLSLGPWNKVLIKATTSRYPLRIKTYGFEESDNNAQSRPERPSSYSHAMPGRNWKEDDWGSYIAKVKEYLALPEPGQKYEINDTSPEDSRGPDNLFAAMTPDILTGSEMDELHELIELKYRRLNTFTYPGAGISYSYEDWKDGKTWKPIIEKTKSRDEVYHDIPVPNVSLSGDHAYQNICLQEEFRSKGLQVIVRVSSIELTPENPFYPGDSDFHVDGLLNEHIVATSRYYYDVDNLESRISFQQENDLYEWDYTPELDAIHKIFNIPYCFEYREFHDLPYPQKIQNLGSLEVKQGRFLAWPNTLRYKMQPFSLKDKSYSGHQRCVIIYLVDPHYRICSTRNVPMQRHDWWREAALTAETAIAAKLPQEIVEIIMSETGDWPMGISEAAKHKKESEEERNFAIKAQTEGISHHNFEGAFTDTYLFF